LPGESIAGKPMQVSLIERRHQSFAAVTRQSIERCSIGLAYMYRFPRESSWSRECA